MKKLVSLRLLTPLLDALQAEAKKENRSLNYVIEQKLLSITNVIQCNTMYDNVIQGEYKTISGKSKKVVKSTEEESTILSPCGDKISNIMVDELPSVPEMKDLDIICIEKMIEEQEAIRKSHHFSSQECIDAIKKKNELIIELNKKLKETKKV